METMTSQILLELGTLYIEVMENFGESSDMSIRLINLNAKIYTST